MLIAVLVRQTAQYLDRPIRQWHAVFAAAFHAFGGNGPRVAGEINFRPHSADRLAAACCGEDRNLQRPRGNRVVLGSLVMNAGSSR